MNTGLSKKTRNGFRKIFFESDQSFGFSKFHENKNIK